MLFIVNPISGNGNKKRIVAKLEKYNYKIAYTHFPGHAEQLAREAQEKTIIAVGGDGTVNEVAKGLIGSDKTLGIIPCGSGDGLALHLGLKRNLNFSLKTIINGKSESLDIATVNGRVFLSVCGVGFDAMVSEQFAKSGKRGLFNYIHQGLKLWKNFKPSRYIIDIDGKTFESESTLITIGNSNQWGNRAKITPLAKSNDGILDITIADKFGTISLPLLAMRLMSGNLYRSNKIHYHKGKRIIISRETDGPAHADGEWFITGRELRIEVIPSAIKVIVP